MQIKSIGIDLGKTTFHLVALGSRSQIVVRKKFSRQQLLLHGQSALVVDWDGGLCVVTLSGRALREQGHEVRLMPAQFVRPYVKSNKNDYRDAEAIAEGVERENMPFVPIKTEDQLDLQALHRVRERLVSRRTSVITQIRAPIGARDQLSERAGQPAPANAGDSGFGFGDSFEREVFKKHRDFFESVISLNDALNEITGRGGAADPREKLIINLALMGMTDAVAIITLVGNGMGPSAMKLARSAMETAINGARC